MKRFCRRHCWFYLICLWISGMYYIYETLLNDNDEFPRQRDNYQILEEIHGSMVQEKGKRHPTKKTTLKMTGIERAAYLRAECEELKHRSEDHTRIRYSYTGNVVRVSYSKKYNTLYCPMCKMGSTFWTRVFQMLDNSQHRVTEPETPFDIAVKDAPPSQQLYDSRKNVVDRVIDASDAFRFLFVRSPYTLLFSAFVDRIIGPNLELWKVLGSKAVMYARQRQSTACGSDVTFQEFITYITYNFKSKSNVDCHVAKFTACSPCVMNYSFVGQMETFSSDSMYILSKLNQSKTIKIFNEHYRDLYVDDAIEHSAYDVFSSKKEITKCISWPFALRRVWRKLQIRGIIGPTRFPLTNEDAETISQSAFIEIAKRTRKLSTFSEMKILKKEAFNEAYSTIPDYVFQQLSDVYNEEMLLFGYQQMNVELTRSLAASNTFKDYLNLTKELGDRFI